MHRHLASNDGTMVRLLQLLRELTTANDFEFIDAPRRVSAQRAFDRGVACILGCQNAVRDRLTVCGEHDETDLRRASAPSPRT